MPQRSMSTAIVTSTNMKRRRSRETRMASAKRLKKSKSGRSDSTRERLRETTCVRDPTATLEQPTDADFNGFAALPQQYLLSIQSASVETNAVYENGDMRNVQSLLRAFLPGIPTFNDDRKEHAVVRNSMVHEASGRRKRSMSVSHRMIRAPNERPASPREPSELLPSPHEIRKSLELEELPLELPNFMNIPLEIRDKIYRELLLAQKAIQVHGNWTFIYKRSKVALQPSILAVNRQIHSEASRVLYGENTFLYLLRDAPSGVQDIDRLAHSDTESIAGDEGDSDSEWEGEAGVANGRSRRRGRAAERPEYDINFGTYAHLFRNIAVEAEHNRYSEDTQASMANAIKKFACGPDEKAQKFNIRKLTVRITPQWDLPEDPVQEGSFTFVNFFHKNSPVLRAIKAVECQYLRVDLLTKYMTGKSRGAQPAADTDGAACRLIMDMRHLRLWRQLRRMRTKNDWWARDPVMMGHRRETLRQSMGAVDNLADHVKRQCHERHFERWTTGEKREDFFTEMDEDGPLWMDQDSVFWTNNGPGDNVQDDNAVGGESVQV